MQLSTSLTRNVIEVVVGGITNKFKIKKRRDIVFFGDILANYIKVCEKAGYSDEINNIGREWMHLFITQLIPKSLIKIPKSLFLNSILGNVWYNLGLLSYFHADKKGDILKIVTKNEGITEIIGENIFLDSLYSGILDILYQKDVELIKKSQTKEVSKYIFELKGEKKQCAVVKTKKNYYKLNYLPAINGFLLKDALLHNLFELRGNNKLFFRGKSIYPLESTLFHLLGANKLLMGEVSIISYNYFKDLIKESNPENKLILLKTLLQTMGWGIVRMKIKEDLITLVIENPPYGLQEEKDNWIFLINMVLGYLWLINPDFRIMKINERYKKISVYYSI